MPDGILILFPGSCPRGGTWGCLGAKIEFRPAVCPLCYFLLNHCTKFKQFWCVSYSHEWGVQLHFFNPAPWGLGEGSKGQLSFNFNYKVNFKEFIPSLVCVLTKERYKTYQTEFSLCCLGHAPGCWGYPGGKNVFVSIWPCGISNRQESQAEQNASKNFILRLNW